MVHELPVRREPRSMKSGTIPITRDGSFRYFTCVCGQRQAVNETMPWCCTCVVEYDVNRAASRAQDAALRVRQGSERERRHAPWTGKGSKMTPYRSPEEASRLFAEALERDGKRQHTLPIDGGDMYATLDLDLLCNIVHPMMRHSWDRDVARLTDHATGFQVLTGRALWPPNGRDTLCRVHLLSDRYWNYRSFAFSIRPRCEWWICRDNPDLYPSEEPRGRVRALWNPGALVPYAFVEQSPGDS